MEEETRRNLKKLASKILNLADLYPEVIKECVEIVYQEAKNMNKELLIVCKDGELATLSSLLPELKRKGIEVKISSQNLQDKNYHHVLFEDLEKLEHYKEYSMKVDINIEYFNLIVECLRKKSWLELDVFDYVEKEYPVFAFTIAPFKEALFYSLLLNISEEHAKEYKSIVEILQKFNIRMKNSFSF